jgi:hypothetical protein
MEPWQKTALMNPCYFAFETVNPMFHRNFEDGSSVIVTINTGYE